MSNDETRRRRRDDAKSRDELLDDFDPAIRRVLERALNSEPNRRKAFRAVVRGQRQTAAPRPDGWSSAAPSVVGGRSRHSIRVRREDS